MTAILRFFRRVILRQADERVVESERVLKANDPVFNGSKSYANNYIRTSKYTPLTFLPKNLFEQFSRVANTYFLILLILQVIPQISSLTWVTTVIPLVLVLSLTALKDIVDDVLRHKSDNLVNSRKAKVLRGHEFQDTDWRNVLVGDIIEMKCDEFVAADLLLLYSSEPNSLTYIETAELDGETNLKVRQALEETAELATDSDPRHLAELDFMIQCEPPNNVLSKFDGTLTMKEGTQNEEKFPLTNDQILLRGCVLRNTRKCYGLVVFAGADTKLMKNSGRAVFKRTSTDRLLNMLIIGIVVFLIIMCMLCATADGIWETIYGYRFQSVLPWERYIPGTSTGVTPGNEYGGAAAIACLIFFSHLIIFNTVVPISLYVSVEFLRLSQSMWINWDVKMYYDKTDTPAKARTTALNEELGQIEYIFSDKTGTLTQNIMTFNKCAISGMSYGDARDEAGNAIPEGTQVQLPPCKYNDTTLRWSDSKLVKHINIQDKEVVDFFTLLALCHTIMPQEKDGSLVYQAQSPDEEALVGAARNFGFVFLNRTPSTITIEVLGTRHEYELLNILDFNNVRKRMSVIVRKDSKIMLLCKGADTTVNARLSASALKSDTFKITQAHLNDYANIGLRTLVLASKQLSDQEYEIWREKHYKASIATQNRDDELHEVYEEIERNLLLVGATAIEDKLQDGVPDAIANLATAGIKIWVLTGDKQETAINIGYSCKLLTEEMEEVFVIDGEEYDVVRQQLETARTRMLEIRRLHGIEEDQDACTSQSIAGKSAKDFENDIPIVTYRGSAGNIRTPDEGTVSLVSYHENIHTDTVSEEDQPFGGFGIVINGHSLVEGLGPRLEMLLLEVGCMCKAVICCRVTPLQKALVVDLVKVHKNSITLSIGDGANDVSMIKTAHIGVGISGQEGMQAVLASDYSIAQFRYLERLLLVHGRWSYLRMCKFLAYFFYKNFSFTLAHFWYAFFIGFSAQTVYDEYFVSFYNVVYTSMPVIILGVFDQDVNDEMSIRFPKLYTPGLQRLWFNKKRFAISLLEGFLTSAVLYFITYGALTDGIRYDGLDMNDRQCLAYTMAASLVLVVSLRCAIETYYWTPLNHLFLWGSILIFFLFHLVFYSNFIGYSFLGTERFMMGTPNFWFSLILVSAICLIPILAIQGYQLIARPVLMDRLRLQNSVHRSKAKSKSSARRAQFTSRTSIRRENRTQSVRSGYAFAHEEGFGDLITSGRYIPKHADSTVTA